MSHRLIGVFKKVAMDDTDGSKAEVLKSAIAIAVLLGLLVYVGTVMAARVDPAQTDARADWLVVSAAVDGLDPWQDLQALAEQYEVDFAPIGSAELGPIERIHPRTPGTLLLLRPLALATPEQAYPLLIAVTASAAAIFALIVAPIYGWTARSNVNLFALAFVGSTAYLSASEFGTQSTVLLLSVGIAWLLFRRSDSVRGGAVLGVAITIKLFPALLLIPLWYWNRRRASAAAALVFLLLNVGGLLVYRLNPIEGVGALGTAASTWIGFSGNGSLAMVITRLGLPVEWVGPLVAFAGLVGAVAISVKRRGESSFAVVTVIALLASPLSWEHYDVVAFVVLGFVLSIRCRLLAHSRAVLWLAITWIALQMTANSLDSLYATPEFTLSGTFALLGRLALLAATLLIWLQEPRVEDQQLMNPLIGDRSVGSGRHGP